MLLFKKHIKEQKRKEEEKKMKELEQYIYNEEEYWKNKTHSDWGEENKFPSIDGKRATALCKSLEIPVNGIMLDNCSYIFMWSKDNKRLNVARVSMHPKTAANIAAGSARYGSGRILREIISG